MEKFKKMNRITFNIIKYTFCFPILIFFSLIAIILWGKSLIFNEYQEGLPNEGFLSDLTAIWRPF